MTSAPGKGLDKFRSAAHKMHLGNHSNEPCQLLLRVSPQRVCSTKSLWAQSCALCPGAPKHTQPGSCPLLVCLAGGICTVGTNIMYPFGLPIPCCLSLLAPVFCLVRCFHIPGT